TRTRSRSRGSRAHLVVRRVAYDGGRFRAFGSVGRDRARWIARGDIRVQRRGRGEPNRGTRGCGADLDLARRPCGDVAQVVETRKLVVHTARWLRVGGLAVGTDR